jgi:hypothetical protein
MPPFSRLFATLGVVALMPLAAQTPNRSGAAGCAHQGAPRGAPRRNRHRQLFLAARENRPGSGPLSGSRGRLHRSQTAGLKPFQEALYTEMLSHIQQTDMGVPVRRGAYLYYSRTVEGKQYPIRCRRKGNMEAPEEVLLDANELGAQHKFVGVGNFVVSDDGNLLAYTVDYTGFRQYTLQVKDLRDGRTLPDTTERVTSVEWAADNRTLFLTTEDAVTKRPDKLWRHALGESAFTLLYEEKDELYDIGLQKTRDKRYLVLGIESKDTSECRYLPAGEPGGAFQVFLPRENKHRYYLDHRGDLVLYPHQQGRPQFRSSDGARKGPRARELEGAGAAPRRRAHTGRRSVPRFRRGGREDAGDRPHPRLRFRYAQLDRHRVSRARVRGLPRRDAGIRFRNLPL